MWRFIAIVAFIICAVFLFKHQGEIIQKVEDYLKTEKTISKVNGASQEKERMLMDAQKQALEY